MNTEEERSRVGVSARKTRMGALEVRDTSMQTEIPSIINRFEPVEILDPADSKRRA